MIVFFYKATEILASDWLSADLSMIFVINLSLKKGVVKQVPDGVQIQVNILISSFFHY